MMKAKIPYRMSKKEKQAMDDEIWKQINDARIRDANENDAAILWTLHLCFGFGKKRLRRYYEFFRKLYKTIDGFKFSQNDIELLKGIGVDIEEWNRDKD
jgi:hypothetical protein